MLALARGSSVSATDETRPTPGICTATRRRHHRAGRHPTLRWLTGERPARPWPATEPKSRGARWRIFLPRHILTHPGW